ncbi:Rieske 2Fe-2S domain-containing protein [Hymenobacter psychrotolerans]|uniref:Rieske [2Fe-2S] domain-containing protein n=1 Tax=Hymenobacter psychrotolerans DSM 18569 TaxID=1121959 RepID=A0A1M7AG79_9BACT|nr:Rieske 2Fe-2S domain-containing protein [Hymenobacter psychrotolerans]SHL41617.1 Rieske [2Fe-2S] domain-containing protein [Hymenobacter psychrotolerans DSM 18569]
MHKAATITPAAALPAFGRAIGSVLLFGVQMAFSGCGSEPGAVEPQIPIVAFNTPVYLTNQEYVTLRSDNGAAYAPGGVRGLIVVRQNASTYYAFERNCPYRANDTCARVRIDASRLFLKDPCCGSQFDLQGRVQQGPANRSLRQYSTSLSGNILTITN